MVSSSAQMYTQCDQSMALFSAALKITVPWITGSVVDGADPADPCTVDAT